MHISCFPKSYFNQCDAQLLFPSHLLLSQINIVERKSSSQRGMNLFGMTFINVRKEYWLSPRSNKRPSVLKSCMLSTELWSSEDCLWIVLARKKIKKLLDTNEVFVLNGLDQYWLQKNPMTTLQSKVYIDLYVKISMFSKITKCQIN